MTRPCRCSHRNHCPMGRRQTMPDPIGCFAHGGPHDRPRGGPRRGVVCGLWTVGLTAVLAACSAGNGTRTGAEAGRRRSSRSPPLGSTTMPGHTAVVVCALAALLFAAAVVLRGPAPDQPAHGSRPRHGCRGACDRRLRRRGTLALGAAGLVVRLVLVGIWALEPTAKEREAAGPVLPERQDGPKGLGRTAERASVGTGGAGGGPLAGGQVAVGGLLDALGDQEHAAVVAIPAEHHAPRAMPTKAWRWRWESEEWWRSNVEPPVRRAPELAGIRRTGVVAGAVPGARAAWRLCAPRARPTPRPLPIPSSP